MTDNKVYINKQDLPRPTTVYPYENPRYDLPYSYSSRKIKKHEDQMAELLKYKAINNNKKTRWINNEVVYDYNPVSKREVKDLYEDYYGDRVSVHKDAYYKQQRVCSIPEIGK